MCVRTQDTSVYTDTLIVTSVVRCLLNKFTSVQIAALKSLCPIMYCTIACCYDSEVQAGAHTHNRMKCVGRGNKGYIFVCQEDHFLKFQCNQVSLIPLRCY